MVADSGGAGSTFCYGSKTQGALLGALSDERLQKERATPDTSCEDKVMSTKAAKYKEKGLRPSGLEAKAVVTLGITAEEWDGLPMGIQGKLWAVSAEMEGLRAKSKLDDAFLAADGEPVGFYISDVLHREYVVNLGTGKLVNVVTAKGEHFQVWPVALMNGDIVGMTVREVSGEQIVVKPRAANQIEVGGE